MWTRQELKSKGKAAFKRNYWKSVAVGFVVLLMTGAAAGSGSRFQENPAEIAAKSGISVGAVIGILVGVIGASMLVSAVVNIFLRNPIQVGTNRFFLKNAEEPAALKELFYSFKNGSYLKTVVAKLLVNLFILLWSLLLVIPGIIKAYEYAMVGYILADDPDMSAMDALRKSKQMMKGHKWNAFVLGLSFLGWEILSALTLGILEIFYVRPYIEATNAELYLALKQ